MYMHQLTFDSMIEKRIAWDWIEQNVETVDRDECLTEKRFKFYRDVELPTREQRKLVKAVNPTSFLVEEL
jgi:hypothetical protein